MSSAGELASLPVEVASAITWHEEGSVFVSLGATVCSADIVTVQDVERVMKRRLEAGFGLSARGNARALARARGAVHSGRAAVLRLLFRYVYVLEEAGVVAVTGPVPSALALLRDASSSSSVMSQQQQQQRRLLLLRALDWLPDRRSDTEAVKDDAAEDDNGNNDGEDEDDNNSDGGHRRRRTRERTVAVLALHGRYDEAAALLMSMYKDTSATDGGDGTPSTYVTVAGMLRHPRAAQRTLHASDARVREVFYRACSPWLLAVVLHLYTHRRTASDVDEDDEEHNNNTDEQDENDDDDDVRARMYYSVDLPLYDRLAMAVVLERDTTRLLHILGAMLQRHAQEHRRQQQQQQQQCAHAGEQEQHPWHQCENDEHKQQQQHDEEQPSPRSSSVDAAHAEVSYALQMLLLRDGLHAQTCAVLQRIVDSTGDFQLAACLYARVGVCSRGYATRIRAVTAAAHREDDVDDAVAAAHTRHSSNDNKGSNVHDVMHNSSSSSSSSNDNDVTSAAAADAWLIHHANFIERCRLPGMQTSAVHTTTTTAAAAATLDPATTTTRAQPQRRNNVHNNSNNDNSNNSNSNNNSDDDVDEEAATMWLWWVDAYRSFLDKEKAFVQRTTFDIALQRLHTTATTAAAGRGYVQQQRQQQQQSSSSSCMRVCRATATASLLTTRRLPRCAVCEGEVQLQLEAVPSSYAWCTACEHGGHAAHLRAWFARHRRCPAVGCDCHCDEDVRLS